MGRNLFDQLILSASENVKSNLLSIDKLMGLGFCKKMLSNYFTGLQMVKLISSVAQNSEVVILDWLLS